MKFEGVMPALVTPLCEDNQTIKEDSARKLIDLHISQGASGFYVLGGTGEGFVINPDQRQNMIEIVVDQVKGRVKVIDHIAAMNLNEAIMLAKHAEKTGVDAIAALPPCFFGYTENDLYNYYKKIANSVNIPLIIYYHPAAQKEMSPELIARIFEIDNVTGVKWSSANYFELMRLRDMTNGEMNVINGPDELLLMGLAAGADAGIGSTYNVMLPQYVELYNSFKRGDIETARKLQYQVNSVLKQMCKYDVIASTKLMCSFMGIDVGQPTFPMGYFTEEQKVEFKKDLDKLGWPFK